MLFSARIDDDLKCLKRYFQKLFEVLQEAAAESRGAQISVQDIFATESQASYHGFAQYIKPDMLTNIYSLLDFWLEQICQYCKDSRNLNKSYKSMKGEGDLSKYHKYLTEIVGLDLTSVQESYEHLDDLRKVRNSLIHGGAHVRDEKQKGFPAIKGIELLGTLIFIEESYIWEMLDHAKKYLLTVAQVQQPPPH